MPSLTAREPEVVEWEEVGMCPAFVVEMRARRKPVSNLRTLRTCNMMHGRSARGKEPTTRYLTVKKGFFLEMRPSN
jgi:hypothetical protein